MLAKNTQLIKPWSFLLFMACAILILPACGGVNASEAEVAAKAGQVNEVSAEAPVPTATPLPPPPTETPVPPTDTSAAANSVVENEAPASTTVEEPAASTETTVETSAVDVQTAEAGANFMCAGSANFGLTCLDETGWHTFTQSDSPLGSDLVYGLTTCADGRMLVTQGQGVSAFDGSNWENYGETDFTSPDAVACDAAGHIWVAHYQGVSMFDGSWTTYPASELATGEAANDLVNDVVIDPAGLVWVVMSNSVASFDGNDWTVFQKGSGFDDEYFFEKAAVDSQGRVWVAHSWGLFMYDGATWTGYENFDVSGVQAIAIDHQDQIWLGTLTSGVFVFNGETWSSYDTANSGLSSNAVNSIATDTQGRLWLGTEYGLDIFDGTTWSAYRMENADLVDNDVQGLAVMGAGPALPEPVEKGTGTMTGQLVREDKQPIANAAIEICVERLGSQFFGPTPCSDQPFVRDTVTDAEGHFTVEALLVGRYIMTTSPEPGQWAQLTSSLGGSISERVLVEAGEETDLGTIIISAE